MKEQTITEVLEKYRNIEYMQRRSIDEHPTARGNEYLEGYSDAIKHILSDLKGSLTSL